MPTRRLALNSFWLLVARVGSQALGLALTGIVARRLGADGLGAYAFIAALVLLGNAATTFGTDTLIIRSGARADQLSPALWLQLSLSAVWVAGTALVPVEPPALRLGLILYSLTLFPMAFYTVATAALRARERMDLFLLANLLTVLLQTLSAALALRLRLDLVALCAGLVGAQILAAGAALLICQWQIPDFELRPRVDVAQVWATARAAWLLAALTALGVLAQRLNILAVSALTSDAATGWFAAGARVVEGLKVGHLAVLGALLPALSRSPHLPTLRAALVRLTALAVTLALAATVLTRPLIALIYGPYFEPAFEVLPIQVWSLIPYTFTAAVSLWLVAVSRERALLVGSLVSLPLMLALYIVLIPRLGWPGAAWAMLAGECLQAVVFTAVFFAQPRAAPVTDDLAI